MLQVMVAAYWIQAFTMFLNVTGEIVDVTPDTRLFFYNKLTILQDWHYNHQLQLQLQLSKLNDSPGMDSANHFRY